jgi:tRNA(fMet)-specific endonuclease VapC
MRRRSPKARWRLERSKPGEVAISSIVAAELWSGVAKSREPERAAHALRDFLAYVTVLDWPAEAAVGYGKIRATLESQGRLIGAMDLLIAAHAITSLPPWSLATELSSSASPVSNSLRGSGAEARPAIAGMPE